MRESIKDKFKQTGRIAGKIVSVLAEESLDSMRMTAKNYSKDKRLSDDMRSKYAQMADGFSTLQKRLHESSTKKESLSDDDWDSEETFLEDKLRQDRKISVEEAKSVRVYFDDAKESQQISSSTSNEDIGHLTFDEWDKKWIVCGKLSCAKASSFTGVGLIRFRIGEEIVFILRALDLHRGGLMKKIQSIQEKNQKNGIGKKINENYEIIELDVLLVGSDNISINVTRNLEKQMIEKYEPSWLQKEDNL